MIMLKCQMLKYRQFILLINVKMSTIVGILTFSIINTLLVFFHKFSFYEQLFHAKYILLINLKMPTITIVGILTFLA